MPDDILPVLGSGDPPATPPPVDPAAPPVTPPADPAAPPVTPPADPATPPVTPPVDPAAPKDPVAEYDWRAKASNGDQKLATLASRYASEHEMAKALSAAQAKISDARYVRIPDDKSSPEEKLAYSKAVGIPEAPEAYKVNVPEADVTEYDKQAYDVFKRVAHSKGYTQAQFDAAIDVLGEVNKLGEQQMADTANMASEKCMNDLMAEWGPKNYRENVNLANTMLQSHGSETQGLMKLTLADGRPLGSVPEFVKMIVGIARDQAGAGAFIGGEPSEGVDLDAKIGELMKLMNTDPKKYALESTQTELLTLQRAKLRRKAA